MFKKKIVKRTLDVLINRACFIELLEQCESIYSLLVSVRESEENRTGSSSYGP